ncbi:DnaJ-domain-containing protein [Aulographum hederae CBS 113979]|uniref:DnaJ-domain-containing protein n=1 Tax=Aulographum hederae CBS 113979 TaxID=1176131 RepID=A0A6G1GV87_9PEZI|nr:DnaJ-domain-containing protein [Aulographum hederae CBS 113979]
MAPGPFKDHYFVLQVAPTADLIDIKKSYRKLALKHHPDKNDGSPQATKLFQQASLNAAWGVLSDPEQKINYDRDYQVHRTSQPHASSETFTAKTNGWYSANASPKAEDDEFRKQKEFKDWACAQSNKMEEIRVSLKKLNAELEDLAQKDKSYEALVNPYWDSWIKRFFGGGLRVEDMEKEKEENIQRMATRRVKEAIVSRLNAQRDALMREKLRRTGKENERQEKVRQSRQEKRSREAEEYVKEQQKAQERMEKEQAEMFQRAAEKREAEKREAERQREEDRSERSRRRGEQQAAEEYERRQEAASARERMRREEQGRQQKNRESHRNSPQPRQSQHSACRHKVFWDKVEGRQTCPHCQQLQYRFLYKCSVCETKGCAGCMKAMKNGGAPEQSSKPKRETPDTKGTMPEQSSKPKRAARGTSWW